MNCIIYDKKKSRISDMKREIVIYKKFKSNRIALIQTHENAKCHFSIARKKKKCIFDYIVLSAYSAISTAYTGLQNVEALLFCIKQQWGHKLYMPYFFSVCSITQKRYNKEIFYSLSPFFATVKNDSGTNILRSCLKGGKNGIPMHKQILLSSHRNYNYITLISFVFFFPYTKAF